MDGNEVTKTNNNAKITAETIINTGTLTSNADNLAAAAAVAGCSLYEATFLPSEKLREAGLKDAAITKFRAFSAIIEQLAQKAAVSDCYELAVETGNASGYLQALHSDNSPEGVARFENVEELFNSIKEFSEEESELRRTLEEDGQGKVDTIVTLGDYLENIYQNTMICLLVHNGKIQQMVI